MRLYRAFSVSKDVRVWKVYYKVRAREDRVGGYTLCSLKLEIAYVHKSLYACSQ